MTPEGEAKKAIADALRSMGWRVLRLNSGIAKRGKHMIHLCPAGTPDILAFDREGVLLWVECKAPFAKKRNDQPEQAEFATWARSVNQRYVLARSVQDVEEFLR